MTQKTITSPVCSIHFMAAEYPVKNRKGEDEYTITLIADEKKDKSWLDAVSLINEAKVVTSSTYRGKSERMKEALKGGKAKVTITSKFKPRVFDAEANELEEAPLFAVESTGTAQVMAGIYEGKAGGTLNLKEIYIHSIDTPEGASTGGGMTQEERRAALKAAAGLK